MRPVSLSAFDAVAMLTPAAVATSRMVARFTDLTSVSLGGGKTFSPRDSSDNCPQAGMSGVAAGSGRAGAGRWVGDGLNVRIGPTSRRPKGRCPALGVPDALALSASPRTRAEIVAALPDLCCKGIKAGGRR